MFDLVQLWFGSLLCVFRDRRSLMLENLALRQQLVVLKRKHPRPKLAPLDKLFLGAGATLLVSMQGGALDRPARNRGSVAPGPIQTVLGHALQGAKTSRRWAENFQTDS